MTQHIRVLFFCFFLSAAGAAAGAAAPACSNPVDGNLPRVVLQVLGSGGPELTGTRASSSYVVWLDGQARLLIDMGTGSFLRLKQSAANLNDIDQILISHFHVDHSNDLPALIKANYFTTRTRDLPLLGPAGNDLMPGAVAFAESLFGPSGAYRYLGEYLHGQGAYHLQPQDVPVDTKSIQKLVETPEYSIQAVAVHHGPLPALAWRVEIAGKVLVFSGDTSGSGATLEQLSAGADLLVAHNAVPEDANRPALNLHMPPSRIGEIAQSAGVKQLVISHRMERTLGQEAETLRHIQKHYAGPVHFADDLECFLP